MKRYGWNEVEEFPGVIVLWVTTDTEPFTHIATITNWDAFEQFMIDQRADW